MTVPSREEAVRLLLSLDPPAWHLRHSRAVAEIAAWLARRVAAPGKARSLNGRLVETAALLHDVDKLPAVRASGGARGRELQHGEVGAAWLAGRGYGELRQAVALHPVTILVDADRASEISQASIEARIVAYADKRAGQRLEPMATRFGHWSGRHPDGWDRATTASAWARARELEEDVCGLATCRPADVRRLAWVGPAIAAARALRAQPPTPAAS